MKKRKKRGQMRLLSAVLGFACALVLGALFYGTMVYQLAGEAQSADIPRMEQLMPLEAGMSAERLFPGALLALEGELTEERTQDVGFGSEICRVVERTYLLSSGVEATAVSASSPVYFERLSLEGWVPQLITGFSLAGLDAVCEQREEKSMLIARSGMCVYALEVQADEQTLYALGAGARLE